jgi:hypothetical protein
MMIMAACVVKQTLLRFIVMIIVIISHHRAPMPAQSFRRHIRSWMRGINLRITEPRELFLRRYEALLVLRGISPYHPVPRQAAMEVLLNLWRFPVRQAHYLKAIIRKINRLICDNLVNSAIPANDGTEWDVPGHIIGLEGFRLAVVDADMPGQAQMVDADMPVPGQAQIQGHVDVVDLDD